MHKWQIEFRPLGRGPMLPWELAEWDQVLADGCLETAGSWLLANGFEFRVSMGRHWLHVVPSRPA